MNLRYTGILFAATLVLSVTAWSDPVSKSQAMSAACGWVKQRSMVDPMLDAIADETRTANFVTTNGASFYTVKMLGGATVILAGDSDDAPVLGYTKSDVDLSTLDTRSPLWTLLNRDVSQAKVAREQEKRKLSYNLSRQRAEKVWKANRALWADMCARGELAFAGSSGTWPAQESVSDVRVAPLVKTQWAQENVGAAGHEWACYNYLTPDGPDFSAKVGGNKNNAVCGCVATAMAQVLKYFEYPNEHLMTDAICQQERKMNGGMKRDCYWVNDDGTVVTNKDVEIVDKPYDWANMTLTPGVNDKVPPMGERAKEIGFAIGQLTFNCGVAVGMQYSANGSGAYSYDVPNALRKTFLVRTAVHFSDGYDLTGGKVYSAKATADTRSNALQRVMFSNFDAGLPVIVGLAGHEVVADGYGYEKGEPFVHFNMGWAGQGDLWYNIPNLLEAGYFGVEDVTYNIFTNKWSAYLLEPGLAVLSGRCLDVEGNPLPNAKVRIFESDTGTEIPGPGPTSANGVWGVAAISAGRYDIYGVSEDGTLGASIIGLEVSAPNIQQKKDSRGDNFDCVIPETPEEIGNSWGNDLVLEQPNYEVDGKTFQRLEDALVKAQANQTIYVLRDAPFEHSFTARVSCAIQVKDGVDATNAVVSVSKGVRLYVANAARLLIKGVLFDCVDSALVEVQKGGTLALAGEVALPTVRTSDATGFELAGAIQPVGGVVCIDCPVAQCRDQLFGTFSCDYPTAIACKTNIVNKYDLELGGVAQSATGKLVWDRVADPATAFACYDEPYAGGRPGASYYNSLTTLFKDCTNNATITILRNCPADRFCNPVTLNKAVTITGAGITPSREAGFMIEAGGKLTLENVAFSNYVGSCLFKVNGGELVLAAGAELRALSTCGLIADGIPNEAAYGTTAVLNGRLTMLPGAVIKDCSADHGQGKGGGIYIQNGILDLQGGEIIGCTAALAGGGIYAYNATNGSWKAEVKLSGNLVITNNIAGATGKRRSDNLCLALNAGLPTVTNALASVERAIGIRYEYGEGNGKSNVFACIEADLDEPQLAVAQSVFFSDCDARLVARATADGKKLFWEELPPETDECAASDAAFVVIYDAHPERPYYYVNADTTFANIQGDATVILTNYTTEANTVHHYYRTIEIAHRVVFKGVDGTTDTALRRHAQCPIHVSSAGELILTNVTISGSYSDGGPYPVIQVEGGKLELQAEADIRSAAGNQSRACGGVVVWDEGVFTMQPGSRIYNTQCNYTDVTGVNRGVGGGVLIDHATAYFNGGRINGCSTAVANSGAGVMLCNEAEAYLQGPLYIWGNGNPANNIVVEDNSRLYLAGPIAEKMNDRWGTSDTYIGVDPGIRTETNLVAHVSWAYVTTNELTASAKRFRKSTNMDVHAIPVTNDVETILVWSTAVATDGTGSYVNRDGKTYDQFKSTTPEPTPVPPEPAYAEPKPIAFKMVARDAATVSLVVTDAVQWCWYSFFATNSLDGGFVLTNAAGDYVVKPVTNFQWQFTTPNIELTLPVDDAWRFWKAEAARGLIPAE